MTHIVDTVILHGNSLNAHTESKSAVLLGVDAAVGKHVGVYHTRTEYLYPALVLADTTALAAAYKAGNVDLCRRLCEGEVVGTEAKSCVTAEKRLCEGLKHSLKVAHGDALVNHKSLYLMEQRGVSCVHRIGAVNTTGGDYSYGRLLMLHSSNLNGRGLGAEKNVFCDIEGVLRVSCRVIFGNVEGLEVVVIVLYLRAFGDGEAHANKDVLNGALYLCEGVELTASGSGGRESDVYPFGNVAPGLRQL